MTIKEKLIQEIESTSESLLGETLDFLQFLKTRQPQTEQQNKSPELELIAETSTVDNERPYSPASGRYILSHAGKWHGDDFEECLKLVYATRSKAKFNKHINPFK